MPFAPGQSGNPKGRPEGAAGKATSQAREAIAAFVEGNVERLNGWLDDIASEDPKAAFACFMDVVEYHIPKLARQEHTGKDGGAIDVNLSVSNILKEIDGRDASLPNTEE